jgi:hypothetical protein
MKITLLFTLLCCTTWVALAQAQEDIWKIEEYTWEEEPMPETRDWIKKQEEAITKYTHLVEFRYRDDEISLLELVHRRIWIGDEKTIQSYNKLYVPVMQDDDLARIEARVLQPNGAVINLDEDDIEEGKDDDGNDYRYFALDGVQEGSIVEYLFLTSGFPRYQGMRYTLQRSAPVYDLNFELVVPRNLIFKTKSYNALKQAEEDTVLTEQNRYYIQQDTLPKFEEEQMAFERAHLGYILFALDRNLYNGMRDISSFGYSVSRIYDNVQVELNKRIEKQYKKIIEESGMRDRDDLPGQIVALENYLKENFFTRNVAATQAMIDVEEILKNGAMNNLGCLRLYFSIFNYAGLECQMVFTSDRSSTPFDPEFENNLFLTEDLFYFPEADIYLAPTNNFSRLGYFDADLRNTDAIFVEGVDLGEGPVGIGEVRFIPPQKETENKSDLLVEWHLAPDGDVGEVKVERKTYGLQSGSNQTIAPLVPEDKTEEFEKDILSWMFSEVDFDEYEVENLEPSAYPEKPLIAKAEFTDEVYTEPGSTSTIVKLGEIIGPQAEMYLEDSVRTLPVNHGFPRWYHREIKLHVPEGHILKNIESLEMLVSSGGADPDMIFESNYTFENGVLHVVIDEWYRGGEYPAELFETYREVINAAADFNKKYVVLEPAEG